LPVRPCAKQRRLAYARGERAPVDLYLFNDTTRPVPGELHLSMIGPDGREQAVTSVTVPAHEPDIFSVLIAEKVELPAFDEPGSWKVRLRHSDPKVAVFEREFWVVGPAAPFAHGLTIGLSGVAQSLRRQLAEVHSVVFEDFRPGQHYDGIIASGLKADEIARRQIGEQTGLEAQPKAGEKPPVVLGELSADVLAAVGKGTPLLALVPEDGLADGVAKQLSALGLFKYEGQVGNLRAPWMGNWNYLRKHPLFEGIPADCATSVLHQVEGQPSNGLLVEGEGVEIIAAYSRDHDRKNGAATMIARKDRMHAVVHRMPDMVQPLQRRFLENAVRWLAGEK
jgi:beta-galactosidase